jgi:hypothetical protein
MNFVQMSRSIKFLSPRSDMLFTILISYSHCVARLRGGGPNTESQKDSLKRLHEQWLDNALRGIANQKHLEHIVERTKRARASANPSAPRQPEIGSRP